MKPRVGVSLCLLGEKVRHDGGHKRDPLVTDMLAEYFEWCPVCPEFEIGMGVPREPILLVADGDTVRLVGVDSKRDWTDEMAAYARAKSDEIAPDLDGFILKKDSPSCGIENVRQYTGEGTPTHDGVGAFARVLMERFPDLPVVDEGQLHDGPTRENFIDRVYAHQQRRSTPA